MPNIDTCPPSPRELDKQQSQTQHPRVGADRSVAPEHTALGTDRADTQNAHSPELLSREHLEQRPRLLIPPEDNPFYGQFLSTLMFMARMTRNTQPHLMEYLRTKIAAASPSVRPILECAADQRYAEGRELMDSVKDSPEALQELNTFGIDINYFQRRR